MNKIVTFDPFTEMQALQKQFFGDDWFTAPSRAHSLPTTDVYTEEDKRLVIEAHLPNFEDKDVHVHVDGNVLEISAERHEQEKDKTKKYVVRESSSSFYRRVRLPEIADKEAIEADIEDGILKIQIPFRELPQPKKIAIKAKTKSAGDKK